MRRSRPRMGRYIIRRLLAPRDEAIDLTEEEYSRGAGPDSCCMAG